MRKRTKHLRGEEGQALVELALVVPLLLFIIFAIIDFGLAINQYNNTTNLANLGARASAVYSANGNANPGSCTYGGKTYNTLVGYIDCEGANEGGLSNVSVTVCDNDPAGTSTLTTGDSVSVHVASTFNWLGVLQGGVGKVGGVVGPTSTIASSATMRMEGSGPTSASWFGADPNPIPGQSGGSIPAPTINSGSC